MESIKANNTTLLLTLSSLFEYYDFIIYGLMSSYLGPLFFPNDNLFISQLQAFALFALGYIVRPLGGLIFSTLADTTNRKKIFVISNLILASATLGIAMLPNYNQIGVAATILLIILRILQAASFSVELPGAIVLMQQSGVDRLAKNFSFVISGTAMGAILASISLYILENNFNREEILNFAWRIPFIFGAILCFISILMRNKLQNYPQNSCNKITLFTNLLPEYKNMLSAIFLVFLPAFLIVANIFFPSFIPKFYGYNVKEVYLAITISMIWSATYAPIFAHLTYKIPKITLLKVIVVSAIFLGLIINFLLLRQELTYLIVALCLYQMIVTSMMVSIFPFMAEIFPENIRFTMITICYNISYSLIAFLPILATNFSNYLQSPLGLWLVLILLCLFILVNIKDYPVRPKKM